MANKTITYEDARFDRLIDYAGADAIVTLDILKKMWPNISRPTPYREYVGAGKEVAGFAPSIVQELTTVKARALQFIVDMEVCGLSYDIPANRIMAAAMSEEIGQLEERVFTGMKTKINLDSGPELARFLYGTKGFQAPLKTKGGDDSTSGDALEKLFETYKFDWLEALLKRNNMRSVYSSFIATYVEDWVKSDGRVHPEYNLHGTSSHRISSDNPNLLNLPRSCYQYDIRALYNAPPGYVFITFDFSSCEVKVLAALCKDPTMLKAIRDGLDFHTFTASLIYGIPYDEIHHVLETKKADLEVDPELKKLFKKYKNMRQAAKAVTFGVLYGSTVASLAMKLEISVDEGQKIVDAYFNTYPRIKEFVDNSHKMALANHFVFTPFGQRKQEFGSMDIFRGTAVYNAALRNSQNIRIQSPASTLGLMAFAKVNEELKKIGGMVACTVYDSWEGYVPISKVSEAIEIGFYNMDDWPQEEYEWLNFPIGADAEIGWDWGNSLTKVHRGISQTECLDLLKRANARKFEEAMA